MKVMELTCYRKSNRLYCGSQIIFGNTRVKHFISKYNIADLQTSIRKQLVLVVILQQYTSDEFLANIEYKKSPGMSMIVTAPFPKHLPGFPLDNPDLGIVAMILWALVFLQPGNGR